MNQFDLYPQAWAVYILLGLALLFLLDLNLRRTGFKRRVGILSFIAAGAFTPQTVVGSKSLAPMILTSLFNAEVEGVSAIIQGLVSLIAVWGIVFATILALRPFVKANQSALTQKPAPDNSSPISSVPENIDS